MNAYRTAPPAEERPRHWNWRPVAMRIVTVCKLIAIVCGSLLVGIILGASGLTGARAIIGVFAGIGLIGAVVGYIAGLGGEL